MEQEQQRAPRTQQQHALSLAKRAARRMWLRSGQRLDRDELESRCNVTAANCLREFEGSEENFVPFLQQRLGWTVTDGVRVQMRNAKRFTTWPSEHDSDATLVEKASVEAWTQTEHIDQGATPEHTTRHRRMEELIDHTLDCLDEQSRAFIVGHYHHGRPFILLSQHEGMSPSQGCRLHRKALLTMRNELTRCGIDSLRSTEL